MSDSRASFKPHSAKDRREAAKAAKRDNKERRAAQRAEERAARRARIDSELARR
jgi:hypothetical protein